MEKRLLIRKIFGLPLFGGDKKELLIFCQEVLDSAEPIHSGPFTIVTPNPEQLVLAQTNREFRSDLESADLALPDGQGIVWAINRSHGFTHQLQRIPGREVFHDLLKISREKNYRVFFVGGKPGSASKVIELFHGGAAEKEILWSYDDGKKEDQIAVLEKIHAFSPHIVFVAYGAPAQERWLIANRESLQQAGVRLAMVVGGAIDYEAGKSSHVPHWIEQMHLEWLLRLITEPWRLKRQLIGAQFFLWILSGKLSIKKES